MSSLGTDQELHRLRDRLREEGRELGHAEQASRYWGTAAITMLAGLFAQAMQIASSQIRELSVEASDFFADEAARIAEFANQPQVESVSPTTDAADVPLDAQVVLSFNTRLDRRSVKSDTVYVGADSGGPHLAAALSYDDTSRTVTLQPENDLTPGVTYRVTVTDEVKGRFGQPAGDEYVTRFATVAA